MISRRSSNHSPQQKDYLYSSNSGFPSRYSSQADIQSAKANQTLPREEDWRAQTSKVRSAVRATKSNYQPAKTQIYATEEVVDTTERSKLSKFSEDQEVEELQVDQEKSSQKRWLNGMNGNDRAERSSSDWNRDLAKVRETRETAPTAAHSQYYSSHRRMQSANSKNERPKPSPQKLDFSNSIKNTLYQDEAKEVVQERKSNWLAKSNLSTQPTSYQSTSNSYLRSYARCSTVNRKKNRLSVSTSSSVLGETNDFISRPIRQEQSSSLRPAREGFYGLPLTDQDILPRTSENWLGINTPQRSEQKHIYDVKLNCKLMPDVAAKQASLPLGPNIMDLMEEFEEHLKKGSRKSVLGSKNQTLKSVNSAYNQPVDYSGVILGPNVVKEVVAKLYTLSQIRKSLANSALSTLVLNPISFEELICLLKRSQMGILYKEDLFKVLARFGLVPKREISDRVFRLLDINKDGLLTEEDFEDYLKKNSLSSKTTVIPRTEGSEGQIEIYNDLPIQFRKAFESVLQNSVEITECLQFIRRALTELKINVYSKQEIQLILEKSIDTDIASQEDIHFALSHLV